MAITREFPWQYQGICFGKTRDYYLTEYNLEGGRYADYMPICELVDGEEECGLLIDDYWLQEGLDYDTFKVLHMFTVILDWIADLWGTSCALSVANAIVRAIPTLSQLVVYLKDMLAQELEI